MNDKQRPLASAAMVLVVLVASMNSAAAPSRATSRADDRPPSTKHSIGSTRSDERGVFATVTLRAADRGSGIDRTLYRVDGGRWRRYQAPGDVLFDGSQESFDQWRHVGPGSFRLMEDGSMETEGGLGLLWYPVDEMKNVALQLEWRDARSDGCCSNSGVFIRFPDPEEAVAPGHIPYDCQTGQSLTQAEWVAVHCGHEIQINDGAADPQATGSIYNFKSRDLDQANATKVGSWNDYEVRMQGAGDYRVWVIRNGELLNAWRNSPGQQAARAGDPPTDDRQWPRGYIGLQNHGGSDIVQFRNVIVRDLSPKAASFTIRGPGRHTLEYRSIDFAGNMEKVHRITFTMRRRK